MMYRCERCGSGFNAIPFVSHEDCPRCMVRDGVSAPLMLEESPSERAEAGRPETDRPPDETEPGSR
jgi:hypothetical protein